MPGLDPIPRLPALRLAALAGLLLAALGPRPSTAAAAGADPRAQAVAERAMAALGGEESWAATRFLRFTFAGARTHHWDKATGRHRLEGKTREGDSYLVLHNLNTREGEAYLNGEKLAGEAAAQWLERAYSAWINDTYWLLMPYKLRDPGVTLSYDGEEEIDGKVYDKLHLRFAGVGLTPGDQYWAYINRETGLMDRWAYILESYEPGQAATHWRWGGWAQHGGIMLASDRVNVESGRELPLADIAVFDQLPDSVFASTAPVRVE